MILLDSLRDFEKVQRTLQQQIRQMEQTHQILRISNDQLQVENEKLQEVINKLLKENHDLQIRTTNMNGTFPALEQILNRFNNFGQQILVGYFSQFDSLVNSWEEFTSFVASIANSTFWLVERQYEKIVKVLFPESLSDFAESNQPISRELTTHLQNNYHQIMSLERWCSRRKTTVVDKFFSATSPFLSIPNFAQETTRIVTEMYDLFCQIVLSKNIKFGLAGDYDPTIYNNPFSTSMPMVVFRPLLEGSDIVAKGFAY